MIKPCYFIQFEENGISEMAAVCTKCHDEKFENGLYWDQKFHPDDKEINCKICNQVIYKE